MPGVYRVELAKTGRSGCQNKACKDNAIKIEKGELRFGTQVEIKEHQTWLWKHWGCVTPVQLASWWEGAEHDPDLIDGLDEIPDEQKTRVLNALNLGHVDDKEWNGDIEKNRPGAKGFRMTAKEKRKVEKDNVEASNEAKSPPASQPKKRSRQKKEVTDDTETEDADQKPPMKKSKSQSKKVKAEDNNDDADVEITPPAKKRKTTKSAEADPSTKTSNANSSSKRKKADNSDGKDGKGGKLAPKNEDKPKVAATSATSTNTGKAKAKAKKPTTADEVDEAEEAPKISKGRKKKVGT